jgi:hypothetical protein
MLAYSDFVATNHKTSPMKPTTILSELREPHHQWSSFFDRWDNKKINWNWGTIKKEMETYLSQYGRAGTTSGLEQTVMHGFRCCHFNGVNKESLILWANALPETHKDTVYRRHAHDVLFLGIVVTTVESTMHETLQLLGVLESGGYTPKDGIVYLLRAKLHKEVLSYISWMPETWKKIEKQVRPFLTPDVLADLQKLGFIDQVGPLTDIIACLVSNASVQHKRAEILAINDAQWERLCTYAHPKKNPKAVVALLQVGRAFPETLHQRIAAIAFAGELRPFFSEYRKCYPDKFDGGVLVRYECESLDSGCCSSRWTQGLAHIVQYAVPAPVALPIVLEHLVHHPAPKCWGLPAAFHVRMFGKPLYQHIDAVTWQKIIKAWSLSDLELAGLYFWFQKHLPAIEFPDYPVARLIRQAD